MELLTWPAFPKVGIEADSGGSPIRWGMAQCADAEMSVSLVQTAYVTHILIVEDECLIRMLAADVAAEQGYVVQEAGDSDEALRILERQPEIGLVFTDIDMPGQCDGLFLAKFISRSWPSIRIVITSGKVRPHADELPEGSLFLAKPYRPEELAAAFAQLLQ